MRPAGPRPTAVDPHESARSPNRRCPFAGPADPELLPHETPRSVGRDEVTRAKRIVSPLTWSFSEPVTTLAFVPQVTELGVESDTIGGQCFGVAAKHRLQHILRATAVGDRRYRLPRRRCSAWRETVDFFARQTFRPEYHASESRGHPRRTDVVFDAHLPVHFHGARIDAAGLGRDRGTRMALDHDVPDAVLGKSDRGRQPDGSRTDDQDVCSNMGASLSSRRASLTASTLRSGSVAILTSLVVPGRSGRVNI